MKIFDAISTFFASLLSKFCSRRDDLQVISPKVLVINIDPMIDDQGTHLTTRMDWHNIDDLINTFITEISDVSYGTVKYQYDKANRIDINDFPIKADKFKYTADSYLTMMQNESTHHNPDDVDYLRIVDDPQLIDRITKKQIDEVWIFGGPWFGFHESTMAGDGAIWCNSDPLKLTHHCPRRFVIMGFNYQRDAGEMVHDIGHRMESIMSHVYGSFNTLINAYNSVKSDIVPTVTPAMFMNPKNDFERFMLFEKIAPGRAEMGLVHTPPNAENDYDWNNSTSVSSTCDDWLNYPKLQRTRRMLSCVDWNCGVEGYDYVKWWFKHVPHVKGKKNGILNNWWKYTMQVDQPF